mmetsp:Transcript_5508/g.7137  ORF Transcript_5508/g.7137 Transcript_5508/m.7137 type:complete len:223 (+) Transcript_5508:46-714(+)|eukprot:CAMPEP_0201493634 /NCGR_PEP_ID=MMETSP0151_2-20130828/40141_1 /ASSEMBLY_ACC=CAM_ASM_000257 /TAXON_ID=200890 /ORGANISM="Paramoeba atlantica, Strain 621/1 / CCAP 1560/9" /LENGTH=222 /DNA_ID=CAMNT_0047881197 /DNA_START=18 /DNA_END=686 /DNA_ORIENTATION=+
MTELPSAVEFDVGNLCGYCPGVSTDPHAADFDKTLIDTLRSALPTLSHKLNELPGRILPEGKIVTCPSPVQVLPREKPIPQVSHTETAWEKFARKKGIKPKGRKQNKMWDDNTKEWRDRWGKRARQHNRKFEWAEEVKTTYLPNAVKGDPFLDKAQSKKRKQKVIEGKRLKNKKRAGGGISGTEDRKPKSRDAEKLRAIAHTEKNIATASMGKFDKRRKKAN